MFRTVKKSLVATLTVVPAAVLFSSAAHADIPDNGGCAPGVLHLNVGLLAGEGYHIPGLVDSRYSGILTRNQPGNGDGWVCGVVRGSQLTSFGLPVYEFSDNNLPAG